MVFGRLWKKLTSGGGGLDLEELARRLGMTARDLETVQPHYREHRIGKRSGGVRILHAPADRLKAVQHLLLHHVFQRLPAHDAAHGFERGRSIVTHARIHAGRDVVVRLDLREFFPTTRADRLHAMFRRLGWNRAAATRLVELTTWKGALPQGAPTSPRLANLVNVRLDLRLEAAARSHRAVYSRYADDLTFSWDEAKAGRANRLIQFVDRIVQDEGYRLHRRKKLRIMRAHHRQIVTGLVVNERPRLPRETRRWLRAVEHRRAQGKSATLTDEQLAGWRALAAMVEAQAGVRP